MRLTLRGDPRVTVRTKGEPDPDGRCVVYWMQRAQRAVDNPALDVAVRLGNELRLPVVTFFGLNPFIERANSRHYRFLVDGLADIAAGLRRRRVGFVLRRYPDHRLLPFANDVRPAIVVGDENRCGRRNAGARRSVTICACRCGPWTQTSSFPSSSSTRSTMRHGRSGRGCWSISMSSLLYRRIPQPQFAGARL